MKIFYWRLLTHYRNFPRLDVAQYIYYINCIFYPLVLLFYFFFNSGSSKQFCAVSVNSCVHVKDLLKVTHHRCAAWFDTTRLLTECGRTRKTLKAVTYRQNTEKKMRLSIKGWNFILSNYNIHLEILQFKIDWFHSSISQSTNGRSFGLWHNFPRKNLSRATI